MIITRHHLEDELINIMEQNPSLVNSICTQGSNDIAVAECADSLFNRFGGYDKSAFIELIKETGAYTSKELSKLDKFALLEKACWIVAWNVFENRGD